MQSKRRASAKALRQEPAWCGQEKARKPVQLKQSEHGGSSRECSQGGRGGPECVRASRPQ